MRVNCKYKELVPIHKLVPNPKNANKHSDKQIEMLAKIIDYQGFRHPIIVSNRSGFIAAGHGRLEAAKKLCYENVPVDFQDFESEAQEHAFMIADNKIAELAETDEVLLQEIARSMGVDFDYQLLGIENFSFLNDEIFENLEDTSVDSEKQYRLEVKFSNDMDMMDIHDDLMSKGYMVKVL